MVGENPHSAWFIPIPSGINLGQLENSPVSFSSTILQFIPAIPKKIELGDSPQPMTLKRNKKDQEEKEKEQVIQYTLWQTFT